MLPFDAHISFPTSLREPEPTGVPYLDFLLDGGLLPGALAIILGPPGSGKTTLAMQIAFAAARREQQALIFTSLSESSSKLIAYMSTYRFFIPEFLGSRVKVVSIQQFLEQERQTLIQDIVTSVSQAHAHLVVLDGFQSVRERREDIAESRRLLYTLGNRLSLLGTTTLITTEADPRDTTVYPEMTTGDVLIGLHTSPIGRHIARDLEVIKTRGRAGILGRHSVQVSAAGLEVFPRLETLVSHTRADAPTMHVNSGVPEKRATFGLEELDNLLGGGLTRRTSTLLIGSLGTAKTLLALQFALAGIQQGEHAVFIGFRETEEQLLEKTASFTLGASLRAALAPEGGLTLRRWEPIELDPDQVALDILTTLERTKASRCVIDSIAELERTVIERSRKERVPNYLAALLAALREKGVTLLALKEGAKTLSTQLDFSTSTLSVLAENVIFLQQLISHNHMRRVLSVLKMRFSDHDYTVREFHLTPPTGLHVLLPGESSRSLVSESSREQGRAEEPFPLASPLESTDEQK